MKIPARIKVISAMLISFFSLPLALTALMPLLPDKADISAFFAAWLLLIPVAGGGFAGWLKPARATYCGLLIGGAICLIILVLLCSLLPRLLTPALLSLAAVAALLLSLLSAYIGGGLRQARETLRKNREPAD